MLPALEKRYYPFLNVIVEVLLRLGRGTILTHAIKDRRFGSTIVALNHFTRFEVALVGKVLYAEKNIIPRYLADSGLFAPGILGRFITSCGALPVNFPNRNTVMASDLAVGGTWVIFPEGSMIKDKKIYEKNTFVVYSYESENPYRPPRTGTAIIAMEAQRYKEELRELFERGEYGRLEEVAGLNHLSTDTLYRQVFEDVRILPVNISYFPRNYPDHAKVERIINSLMPKIDNKLREELVFDGALLTYGVDIDVRFEQPLCVKDFVNHPWLYRLRNVFSGLDQPERDRDTTRRRASKIMQQYMRRIYFSTTVNLNHIASELILQAVRTIGREEMLLPELRHRIFLVLDELARMKGVFIHRALASLKGRIEFLYERKVPLLDQYLAFCALKGLLTQEGEVLRFSPAITSEPDFQQIRLVNPIKVASNEIQPLTQVVEVIKRVLRREPESYRQQLHEALTEFEREAFEQAYATYSEGQRLDKVFIGREHLGRPRLFEGRRLGRGLGVLLIHGITACPGQMAALGAFLAERGHHVYCLRLAGHGTSAQHLRTKSWRNWYNTVKRGYALLRYISERVAVVGQAGGSMLGLLLAAERSEMAGLISVSTSVELRTQLEPLAWILQYFQPYLATRHVDRSFHYAEMPTKSLAEVASLRRQVRRRLPEVRCPTLFLQGRHGFRPGQAETESLFHALPSTRKELRLIADERRTCLLGGEGCEAMYASIAEFLEALEAGSED